MEISYVNEILMQKSAAMLIYQYISMLRFFLEKHHCKKYLVAKYI